MSRPTPETDAAWACFKGYLEPLQDVKDLSHKLERERNEAREALRIIADCQNWFHTTQEEGGPYTAWRGKGEPDEIAEEALKEKTK